MILFLISLFSTMVLMFYVFFYHVNLPAIRVKLRIKKMRNGGRLQDELVENEQNRILSTKLFSQLNWWSRFNRHIRRELKQANFQLRNKEFFMIIFISWIAFFLLGFLLSGSIVRSQLFAFFGLMIPFLAVSIAKKKRNKILENQLGEFLSSTSNSLKAGYSILQAMEVISREIAAPLSDEIQRLVQEMQLGVPIEEAFLNLNERVKSKDLDLIITAILIQRQVGGNLSKILDNISKTIRERIKLKGEIRTLTSQGRMSGIIFMILPIGLGLFLYLINPEYISLLFTEKIGWMLLFIALSGQAIGIYFIRKIVRIDL